ncbi:hypothetical protein pb186bvf_002882 [Paramecium bursaria]
MMLFNSSWDDKIRTNEKLYHLDYIGTCSTCNIKDKRAIIRCAYSHCKIKFHYMCLQSKIYYNQRHDHNYTRFLVYCKHHIPENIPPVNDLQSTTRTLFDEHVAFRKQDEPGQIRRRKRSRSHEKRKKKSRSSSLKFSSDDDNKRKQIPLVMQPMKVQINEVKKVCLQPKESTPEPIIEAVKPQKVFPDSMIIEDDPKFPSPNRYDDQKHIDWWSSIDKIYFKQELKQLELTEHEMPKKKWAEREIDYSLVEEAQKGPEHPIQLRYQFKDTINVLFKFSQNIFARYYFTGNFAQSCSTQSNKLDKVKLYRNQELVDINLLDGEVGKDLLCIDLTELTQDEYQEVICMEDRIYQVKTQLENEIDDVEQFEIHQIDIAYHYLREQLNSVIDRNNYCRQTINNALKQPNLKQDIELQEKLCDLIKWSQIVKGLQNGLKDKQDINSICLERSFSTTDQPQKGLKNSQVIKMNNPLDTDCMICFDGNLSDHNPVTYCGKCQNSFHKICYGIAKPLPEQEYVCDYCEHKKKNKVETCKICKKGILPLKKIVDRFYHVTCLVIVNFMYLKNGNIKLKPSYPALQEYVKRLSAQTNSCAICGGHKGLRINCSQGELIQCAHSFHPTCAYLAGLPMELESNINEVYDKEFATVNIKLTCALHSAKPLFKQAYYRRYALNFDGTARNGSMEEFMEAFQKKAEYRYLLTKEPLSKNDNIFQNFIHNGKAD